MVEVLNHSALRLADVVSLIFDISGRPLYAEGAFDGDLM
jgi:hypothetical protein